MIDGVAGPEGNPAQSEAKRRVRLWGATGPPGRTPPSSALRCCAVAGASSAEAGLSNEVWGHSVARPAPGIELFHEQQFMRRHAGHVVEAVAGAVERHGRPAGGTVAGVVVVEHLVEVDRAGIDHRQGVLLRPVGRTAARRCTRRTRSPRSRLAPTRASTTPAVPCRADRGACSRSAGNARRPC